MFNCSLIEKLAIKTNYTLFCNDKFLLTSATTQKLLILVKKLNQKQIFSFLILLMFTFSTSVVSAHEGEVHLTYPQDKITAQFVLTMHIGQIAEFNVTLTSENSTLTGIVEVLDDSGALWGFFLESPSVYYQLNRSSIALSANCMKYASETDTNSVSHIGRTPGNYVLAFYDTHDGPENDTFFRATFLEGYIVPGVSGVTATQGLRQIDLFTYSIELMVALAFFGIIFLIYKKRRI